jgi:hypothetical protein
MLEREVETAETKEHRPAAAKRDDAIDLSVAALTGGHPDVLSHAGVMNIQRAAGNASVSSYLEDEERSPVHDVIESEGGQPLDAATRERMESALGHDFSDVRIHTDERAAKSAASVDAHAYTTGENVVFGDGRYRPGTDDGERTLAHELAHVVQQRSGPVSGTPMTGGINVSEPADPFERQADLVADRVTSEASSVAHGGASDTTVVQRQAVPEEELTEEEEKAKPSPLPSQTKPEEELVEEE